MNKNDNYLIYNKYTENDRDLLLDYLFNKSYVSWFKIIETKQCFYLYSENKKLKSKFHRKLDIIRDCDTTSYISFGNKNNKIKKIRITTNKKLYVYKITLKVKSPSLFDLAETKKFFVSEIDDKIINFVKDHKTYLNINKINNLYRLLENMTTKTDMVDIKLTTDVKRSVYYKSNFYMFEYYEHNGFLLMGYEFHYFMSTRFGEYYENILRSLLNELFGFNVVDISF